MRKSSISLGITTTEVIPTHERGQPPIGKKTMIVLNLDKLLAARKMQSLELAGELDCTVQTISRIKTGKIKSFRMETLNKICEFFKCQPGDVLEFVSDDEAIQRFGTAYVEDHKRYHN